MSDDKIKAAKLKLDGSAFRRTHVGYVPMEPQQTRLREVWERFRLTKDGTPEHDRLGDELVDILFGNVAE